MNQKISISLDENIVKLIDMERGDIPRSRYIENVLKSTGTGLRFFGYFLMSLAV